MNDDAVSFNDDLYAGLNLGGTGLLGFVRRAFWYYARHDSNCKPGKWHVSLCSDHSGDFADMTFGRADAVVDDFGTLRRVPS